MRNFLLGLTAAVFLAGSLGADTRELKVPTNTLGEVRIEAGTGTPGNLDIDWEARTPLDLPYHVCDGGLRFIFWSGSKPAKLVVVSDTIDWEARKRDKTRWIITVEGLTPPDPEPNPEPDPNPPGPGPNPDVPDRYKLGKLAYSEAMKLPATAKKQAPALSEVYRSASSKLAGLSGDTVELTNLMTAEIWARTNMVLGSDRNAWNGWRTAIRSGMEASWRSGDQSKEQVVGMLAEIAEGLDRVK